MARRRNDYRRRRARFLPFLAWTARQVLLLLRVALFLAVLAGISLGLMAAYSWITSTEHLALQEVRVQGNRRLSQEEVERIAGVRRGKNILALSIGEVEERLSRNPWIERVLVRRELPDRLTIRIREREAVYWVQEGEAVYYADEQGRRIAPVRVEHFVSLPLVHMRQSSQRQKEVLEAVTGIFARKDLPFSLAEVGWITFLCDEIMQIFLYDRAMTVRLSAEALEKNAAVLQAVWRDLDSRGELRQADRIMALDGSCWVRLEREQATE